jgi:hypothetical protein
MLLTQVLAFFSPYEIIWHLLSISFGDLAIWQSLSRYKVIWHWLAMGYCNLKVIFQMSLSQYEASLIPIFYDWSGITVIVFLQSTIIWQPLLLGNSGLTGNLTPLPTGCSGLTVNISVRDNLIPTRRYSGMTVIVMVRHTIVWRPQSIRLWWCDSHCEPWKEVIWPLLSWGTDPRTGTNYKRKFSDGYYLMVGDICRRRLSTSATIFPRRCVYIWESDSRYPLRGSQTNRLPGWRQSRKKLIYQSLTRKKDGLKN